MNFKTKKIYILLFIFINIYLNIIDADNKYFHDDLTLVSAYYQIKSKHTEEEYLKWINNIVLLNKSFVFFTNKQFMPTLKRLRPKDFHNKTVFIDLELEDFFSYKKFYKNFKESFEIDFENSYHTVPLYIIQAEKCMFLKKAILKNYFKSKCFYWIDAGYFRDSQNDMKPYVNDWPSIKLCNKDKKLLMGQIKNFTETDKKRIINFDTEAHKTLQRNMNVAGNMFGGKSENILKFSYLYYNSLRAFIKRKIFIGKDQNIYTFIAFSHPEIINLIYFKTWFDFKILLV